MTAVPVPGPVPDGSHPSSLRVASRSATVAVVVCRVEGEADHETRHLLDEALAEAVAAAPALLVVDVAPLTFCDSACLNALLQAHHDAEAVGVWLVLVGAGPQLQRLLEVTGAGEILTLRSQVRVARPPHPA